MGGGPVSRGYASIAALLGSVFFMVIGNGILGTLLPLRAKAEGFGQAEIGYIASAFFGGMLLGALIATRVIRQVGHVRAIAACIALAACSSLMFALHVSVWSWILMRFAFGLAFAGLYAAIEAWLQGKSTDSFRGRLLGLYSVIQYVGWALGNQFVGLGEPTSFAIFSIAALTLCCALFPLMLADVDPPEAPRAVDLRLLELYRQSPIAVVGTLLVGVANGCFWSLMPVYASDIGLMVAGVALFMTMTQVGAGLAQIPVGRLSDRFDRRMVLAAIALLNAVMEFALGLSPTIGSFWGLMAMSFLLGGVVSTQYYVIAAHANDRTEASETVRISACLLLIFCVGGVVGPITGAWFMKLLGPGGMFLHNGLLHAAIAGFVLYRIIRRAPPVPVEGEAPKPRPLQ